MRNLVRNEGPITRKMARDNTMSFQYEMKCMKMAIFLLAVVLLVVTIRFRSKEDKNNESIPQQENKCWSQFKELRCDTAQLTPECKQLYECSFQSFQPS